MDAVAWRIPALVDRVPATYVEWREEHARGHRHLRAMVCRGSHAARFAAGSISELERSLWNSDPDQGPEPRVASG